ncbi:MAG: hypothetical protein CIT03_04655 [Methanobacterium sp.]|nr:MAG: hypothetical protein CIT03_04655 [Methanobacterium sp.]
MPESTEMISLKLEEEEDNLSSPNPLADIILGVVIPSIILMKLSSPDMLGYYLALFMALVFPLGLGIYRYLKARKMNLFALLGFSSVILTGILGLFGASALYFAFKEALIPTIFALAFLISMKTKKPLIISLFLNEKLLNVDLIEEKVYERSLYQKFNNIVLGTNLFFVDSFGLSAILNFVLAVSILQSPPQSAAFLEELGKMNFISFPVILIPVVVISILAVIYFYVAISNLLELPLEEITKKK